MSRALVLTAVVQSVVLALLLGQPRPGFLVTPYYRPGGREADWRSFDRLARRCLDQGSPDLREDLRRGLDAEDELFRLRNRIHALNVETSRRGAEMLEGASAFLGSPAAGLPAGADPLEALEEAGPR